MPLAVSAGLGFGLVLGAAAVTLSPAIGAVVATLTTCSSTSACIGGTNSGSGPGVAGASRSGNGVTASSTSSNAILATNNTANHATILAQQSGAGTAIAGAANKGSGVSGTATTGTGVSGTSTSGTGVSGSATTGTGVYGTSKSGSGVIAASTSSYAILASNKTATQATILASQQGSGTAIIGGANKGFGVVGSATSGTGVEGSATSGPGVQGISSTGAGVSGRTATGEAGVLGSTANGIGLSYGVEGVATNTSNGFTYGVYGSSADGTGVYGTSSVSFVTAVDAGVLGYASGGGDGVNGTSNNGIGVKAYTDSTEQPALYAQADGGYDVATLYGTTSDEIEYVKNYGVGNGITVNQDDSQGEPGVAFNAETEPGGFGFGVYNTSSGSYVFSVDANGDVNYRGSLTSVVRANSGLSVASYTPRSSAPTIEDNGSAQLVGGFAAVRLDPTFAGTIDSRVAYHVTVTPDGDTRGLYIAAKTPIGFTVRESQDGRSTVSFDYRVVATASGQAGVRMAAITHRIGPRPYNLSAAAHAHRPLAKPRILSAMPPRLPR
jgi:hypothetical protein